MSSRQTDAEACSCSMKEGKSIVTLSFVTLHEESLVGLVHTKVENYNRVSLPICGISKICSVKFITIRGNFYWPYKFRWKWRSHVKKPSNIWKSRLGDLSSWILGCAMWERRIAGLRPLGSLISTSSWYEDSRLQTPFRLPDVATPRTSGLDGSHSCYTWTLAERAAQNFPNLRADTTWLRRVWRCILAVLMWPPWGLFSGYFPIVYRPALEKL